MKKTILSFLVALVAMFTITSCVDTVTVRHTQPSPAVVYDTYPQPYYSQPYYGQPYYGYGGSTNVTFRENKRIVYRGGRHPHPSPTPVPHLHGH